MDVVLAEVVLTAPHRLESSPPEVDEFAPQEMEALRFAIVVVLGALSELVSEFFALGVFTLPDLEVPPESGALSVSPDDDHRTLPGAPAESGGAEMGGG